MAYLNKDLREMRDKLYAAREDKKAPLTLREIGELFGLCSTSAVTYRMNQLISVGLAIKVSKGNKYHTYDVL